MEVMIRRQSSEIHHQSAIESESNETLGFENNNRNDDEFEFPPVFTETDTCPVAADEIFCDGKILPIFTNLKNDLSAKNVSKPPVKASTRRSLSRLFTEDRDFEPQSCSSSETDELDGLSRDTYCKWAPNRSSSTGTSRRWKFPSLLRRCNSDNRDAIVFYGVSDDKVSEQKSAGKVNATPVGHYMSNRAEKDWNPRRSYLPYKQDLIGLFANVNRSR